MNRRKVRPLRYPAGQGLSRVHRSQWSQWYQQCTEVSAKQEEGCSTACQPDTPHKPMIRHRTKGNGIVKKKTKQKSQIWHSLTRLFRLRPIQEQVSAQFRVPFSIVSLATFFISANYKNTEKFKNTKHKVSYSNVIY